MEPENYNFALSLGLGLGRTGKAAEGLQVLKRAQLSDRDPSYRQKAILRTFFEAMVHAYAGHYHRAIPLYDRCIELQQALNEPEVLSIMYNAKGYAILLNQGRGLHGPDMQEPHYQVHQRDMLKALRQFELALESDAENESARYNYQVLSDSLQVEGRAFETESGALRDIREGNTYQNLPGNVSRAMDFINYDEVVFLLDISGSMVMEKVICKGATRFEVMKETMQQVLDEMGPDTKVGIGTIGGDCGTEPKLWQACGALSRRDLRRKIGFLAPDGTTPLLTMLSASPELFTGDAAANKAIFLVSDGANVCSAAGLDICEWARALPAQTPPSTSSPSSKPTSTTPTPSPSTLASPTTPTAASSTSTTTAAASNATSSTWWKPASSASPNSGASSAGARP